MRYAAVAFVFTAALAAIVALALFGHFNAEDLFCPAVLIIGAGVAVGALIMGKTFDDLL